jgi:nitronate monooxygenase
MTAKTWPDQRIIKLLGIETPILQAPMAGADSPEMAIAVTGAGGLGALACAMLSPEQVLAAVSGIRAAVKGPLNLNFFCHVQPAPDAAREDAWRKALAPYYRELGLDPAMPLNAAARKPFDAAMCAAVESCRPEVVSFHFGLPEAALLARVKAAGAKVLASATSVGEALWLEARGCDAVIAQGYEAGGHRGMFLEPCIDTQAGTMALVPQMADAVNIPVIAAGGIGDARGIAAAFKLGASAAQLGTAYLFCPEARIAPLHLEALKAAKDSGTALTNLFSGRPARGFLTRFLREMGPVSPLAPEFPDAAAAVAPLRAKSAALGSPDFMQMWAGQAAPLGRVMGADELTRRLAGDALNLL